MKQEIITYLAGPRNFIQGVELYEKYGINRMLKKSFRRQGETETMKAILLEELRKLAGLSEREFKTIRRNSKQPAAVKMEPARDETSKTSVKYSDDLLLELAESFGVSVEELVSSDFRDKVLSMDENADRVEELEEELDQAEKRYKAAPETVTKMIRFREKFTFLNSPDCPDILKILVSDMFTAYGSIRRLSPVWKLRRMMSVHFLQHRKRRRLWKTSLLTAKCGTNWNITGKTERFWVNVRR